MIQGQGSKNIRIMQVFVRQTHFNRFCLLGIGVGDAQMDPNTDPTRPDRPQSESETINVISITPTPSADE